MKAKSLIAILGKRLGVDLPGMDAVMPKHPTLGDVDSAEALAGYQCRQARPQGVAPRGQGLTPDTKRPRWRAGVVRAERLWSVADQPGSPVGIPTPGRESAPKRTAVTASASGAVR